MIVPIKDRGSLAKSPEKGRKSFEIKKQRRLPQAAFIYEGALTPEMVV
jgi:hypothetical protein